MKLASINGNVQPTWKIEKENEKVDTPSDEHAHRQIKIKTLN